MTTATDPQASATVVRELAKLAEENLAATIIHHDVTGREFVIRRNDFTVQEITRPNVLPVEMPKLVTAAVQIDTAASMIDYVNRFKNPDTMLFADEARRQITAVIDYHKESNGTDVSARLGQHVATLTLTHSDQWNTWSQSNETLMKHVDFATFLEENQFDVARPTGAELLELCRDLQVKEGYDFSSSVRFGDTVKIEYQKENDVSTKSSISFPVNFDLSLPVFFGEPNVSMMAWSRRKVERGALSLGYKLSQMDTIVAREFARIVGEVKAGVDLALVYGRHRYANSVGFPAKSAD